MMKIGLIADIHADPDALAIALEQLDSHHQVDLILCAGDLTGYGKQPNPVIDIIRQREIPTVRGNHDSPSKDITEANAAFLRGLPMHWRDEIDGIRLMMFHGRPGIPFFGLHPVYTQDDELNHLLEDCKADILIAAHTHIPMYRRVPNGLVINPGSVYMQSDEGTSHTYGVLHLPSQAFDLHNLTQPTVTTFS